MSASIKKVVLCVGKKEVELSVEEAKELKDILNKTFGEEKTVERIVHDWVPYKPYPWTVWTTKWSGDGIVYCSNNTSKE